MSNGQITQTRKSEEQERQVLALEALSRLAGQFAASPVFENLLQTLALTVSGQFAVPNVFIVMRHPGTNPAVTLYCATGRFLKEPFDVPFTVLEELFESSKKEPGPLSIETLLSLQPQSKMVRRWSEIDVQTVAPFVFDNHLAGAIGLGTKVNRSRLTSDDLALLRTLVTTISPLIANSFLFAEVTNLSAWYLKILDNVRQGIIVIDSKGVVKKQNRAATEIVKTLIPSLPESTAVDKTIEEVLLPTIFPGWMQRLKAAQADTQAKAKLFETLIANDNGRERIFNVQIGSLTHPVSSETETIMTLFDVTEQKENERRMLELDKFAELGVTVSSISHELNNHLGVLLGGIEIAQSAIERGDQEKTEAVLSKLKENVVRMGRYTSSLMDHTRVNSGKAPGCLNDVVTDVMTFISAQKRFARLSIDVRIEPDLPSIEMDRDQFAQLLINLMNNAADAVIEAKPALGMIVVRTFSCEGQVGFSVEDNGSGILPEVRDQLFKRHLTTKPKGHGYGLVTCARILENHQGQIQIDSLSGEGSKFTFTFPISSQTVATQTSKLTANSKP